MTANSPTPKAVSLRECPMCGGEAALLDYEAKYGGLHYASRCPQCTSCGCSMGYLPSAKKAIAAWNRRASPADGVVVPRLDMKMTLADAIWRYDNGEFTASRVAMVKAVDILAAASPALAAAPAGGGEAVDWQLIQTLEYHGQKVWLRRADGFETTAWANPEARSEFPRHYTHWQAEPRERTVAEVFVDDPAEAIRQAIARLSTTEAGG